MTAVAEVTTAVAVPGGPTGNRVLGDREPEAWDAWRASAPDGGQDA